MNILIYSHYFPPSVGGVERFVERLAKEFAERGHGVTVATATPAGEASDADFACRVVRQPGLVRLAGLIRGHDVTHLAGPALLPMILAWLLRRPAVVEHHVYQAICPNGLLIYQPTQKVCPGHFQAGRHRECLRCNAGLGMWRSFRMWALGFPRHWFCKKVACNVAITNHVLRRLSLPHTQMIYHGVPPMKPFPLSEASQDGRDAIISFAYVGRFVPEKGMIVLVEAAALLDREGLPFRLIFVGDGPERPGVEAAVERLGLQNRVTFTGMLGTEDLQRATAEARVLVVPSLWEELFGLAPMEQMMRGKALIVSSIGGLAEVVGDAGLQFPPGDSKSLASCMRRLALDPELVRKLGESARHRALTLFQESAMIDAHLRVYRNVSFGRPEPSPGPGLG
ncbi:MAG TPA: glycosyltransferase family 4 protein [Candidatus Dormibacteraeota bacterium]|nr:glycosyltransferase family 4 protein [Candidatus Dormibacteraeota bacterium]